MITPPPHRPTLHEWASLRIELLWAYSGRVQCHDRRLKIKHNYGYWLWLLQEGHVEVTSENQTLRAGSGQWILCPVGPGEQSFSEDARILSLHFLCQWPTGENLFPEREGLVFPSARHPRLHAAADELHTLTDREFPGARAILLEQTSTLGNYLKLQSRFSLFLDELLQALERYDRRPIYSGAMDHRVGTAIRCLNGALLADPFPISRLLRETGVSRVHLDRMLCNQVGLSSREYWEKRREEEACHRLESTDQSVKEIGFNLGFKQASHFTNWFKRRKGVSPLVFRRDAAAARLSE